MQVVYLLVIVYLSYIPGSSPTMQYEEFGDIRTCKTAATKIFDKVKAGQVRAFCFEKSTTSADN